MSEGTEAATIGHNNPPSDQALLQEFLQDKTSQLRTRYQELIDGMARMPAVVDDEEMAGKFADMIKLVTANIKAFETMRVGEKEPYLTLSRTVDGYFKKFTDQLDQARKTATKPLEAFLRKREDEKRAAAQEAARVERENSERLAREAEELAKANMPKAAEETLKEAVRESNQADKSEKLADAKPAELARLRGDYGGLATLRTTWVGEIIDKKAVDLEALRPFISEDVMQKLINAAVKAGFRDIAGVKIYERSDAQVR